MKPVIRNLLIVFLLILLGKLFIIPPKNLYWASESIQKSKRVNAYVGECKIFRIDTLMVGYEFPIEKIWVEKYYNLGRNIIGIVIPVTKDSKRIIFDIIPNHPFFRKGNFSEEWVIKDSLTHRIGCSNDISEQDCYYQRGDTAIFNVFRLIKDSSNIWRDESMEHLFKVYTICDWDNK